MEKIAIICIDDDREVLEALVGDLEEFSSHFVIEPAESASDAAAVISELLDEGFVIGIVLADHLMPGTNGVDYLIEMNADPNTAKTKKVLVTAQAGLEDTVRAVNRANLDHYIRKPWTKDELHEIVVRYLTEFVIENSANPLKYASILDGGRIYSKLAERGGLGPA